MSIQITSEMVSALSPDSSSTKAGKKLGTASSWRNTGQNAEALWGECLGSRGDSSYFVRIEPSSLASKCNCPSPKNPCKHTLGLLFLAAADVNALPESAESPEWVVEWLRQRESLMKRRETLAKKKEEGDTTEKTAAQKKRIDKREAQVTKGLQSLELWLHDLVRNGLAEVGSQGYNFWNKMASQMIDSQAPGIAARLRTMASIPNSSPDWPDRLLGELGKLELLIQAYSRIDTLNPALQEDVRQLIGWTVKQDEVIARGEPLKDAWMVLGQWTTQTEGNANQRMQRTWMKGLHSGRSALVLQFSMFRGGFEEHFPAPGMQQEANLVFWPGAAPQRARFTERYGTMEAVACAIPGHPDCESFLNEVAGMLGRQPWTSRFLCTLQNVIPVCQQEEQTWLLYDSQGQALPLQNNRDARDRPGVNWTMLALSGGHPLHFVGEWDGERLMPLGVQTNERYYHLKGDE